MAGILVGLLFIAAAIDPEIFIRDVPDCAVVVVASLAWCIFLDIMHADKGKKV